MNLRKCLAFFFMIGFVSLGLATPLSAKSSINVGYHNPPGSTVGINGLWVWDNIGLELGLGWLNVASDDDSNSSSVHAAGDINLKYIFSGQSVRPYLQGGYGLGLGASAGDSTGASAGLGGGFAGIGLMFGGAKYYAYASGNYSTSVFGQFGVGVWL